MLKGKTVVITGASRGIGKALALRFAMDGANIVILAKTDQPHPKLEGTIHTAAKEIEALGARALPISCDIRFEDQVKKAVEMAVKTFGGIDILVNNASAISLTNTQHTDMKRYDLMNNINARGTFLCSQVCIPYLKKAQNPHILTISPPPSMNPRWWRGHAAYTLAKMGMSFVSLGMAQELRRDRIAVNCLWPKTVIATAAVQNLLGGDEMIQASRTSDIMADAAYDIVTTDSTQLTGNFMVDEELVSKKTGLTGALLDIKYGVLPGAKIAPDFFLDDQPAQILCDECKFKNSKL